MKHPCSGVILAGGLNTRFSGKNKALIEIHGTKALDRIKTVFESFFDDIILISNDPFDYPDWEHTIAADLFSVRSSLTGIHAGLFTARHPHAFIMACDAPLIKTALLGAILDEIESSSDVIIPQISSGLEPLFAVYSKRCLKPIQRQLESAQYKIQAFFPFVRVKKIPEDRLTASDPDLTSFLNINTPEELCRAEAIFLKETIS